MARIGDAFGDGSYESLPKIQIGDIFRDETAITKVEFGETAKGHYPSATVTLANGKQMFTTKSALVKTLARDEVCELLSNGESLETEVIERVSNKNRKGAVFAL